MLDALILFVAVVAFTAIAVACFPIKGLPAFTLHPQAEMPPRFALKAAEFLAGIDQPFASGDPRSQLLREAFRKIEEPGIEFETHPKFTRTFRLQGPDREAVRALFQPAILDFFERQAPAPVSVESAANWLVVYRRQKLVLPAKMADFTDQTAAIGRLFLSHASHR